jgi:hypothetical protein
LNSKHLAAGIALSILLVICIGTLTTAEAFVYVSLESCDSAGGATDVFNVGGDVYAKGTGLTPGGSYFVYVVPDQVNWGALNGQNIPAWQTQTAITADGSGNFKELVWSDAQYGLYDLVLDINGNGKYDSGIDLVDSDDVGINVNTAGLLVVPEYALGSLAALGACFVGLVVFKKRTSLHL